jgi:RNA polymerase sigma-70 factor (ECF subfamily)
LGHLPDDQRRILELRLAGLSGPETAAALGKTHGAVKIAQHRAFTRLRGLLGVGAGKEACDGRH